MAESQSYESLDRPIDIKKVLDQGNSMTAQVGNLYEDIGSVSYERDSITRTDIEPTVPAFRIPEENGTSSSSDRRMYGKVMSPIRKYDGLSDPAVWLVEYETITEGNLWNSDMKLLRLIDHLDGAARNWYLNQKKRHRTLDWVLIRQELINRFSNSCDNLMRYEKINRIKQGKLDFVTYWENKEAEILNSNPEMSDQEIITHMINGLNEGLKQDVLKSFAVRNCRTIEEVRTQIKSLSEIREYFYDTPTEQRRVRFRSNAFVGDRGQNWRSDNPNSSGWFNRSNNYNDRNQRSQNNNEDIRNITRMFRDIRGLVERQTRNMDGQNRTPPLGQREQRFSRREEETRAVSSGRWEQY